MCPQLLPLGPSMSEDCLYLNVFSPKPPSENTLLPVMFWIHGGSYRAGTGATFNSSELANKGVVVVTMNYRLEVLGFLSTMDHVSPGNYGLLDQILALKWVKDNIASFHGDPNDITLFGESAGGASVSLLRLSPLTQGLFHKAIIESGVALSPWAVTVPRGRNTGTSPLQRARDLAMLVQCGHTVQEGSAQMVQCLRNVSIEKLLVAAEAVHLPVEYPVFTPTVETVFGVIPDAPLSLLRQGMGSNVSTIRGVNKDEYSVFARFKPVSVYTSREVEGAIRHLAEDYFPDHVQEVVDQVTVKYITTHNFSTPQQLRNASIQFQTDFGFIVPTVLESRYCVNTSTKAAQYLYEFIYRATHSTVPSWAGVTHTAELPFVFGQPFMHDMYFTIVWPYQWSEQDQRVSSNFMDMWTNFAKYGNPTPQTVDNVTWSPFTIDNQNYLEIGSDLRMRTDLLVQRVQFWVSLMDQYGGVW